MATEHIHYDILTQEALRGVVQRVLADVAKNGLPGEHHFYVSFDTLAEGVRLSPRLLAQYPEEMTIVLQHQFWDLTVSAVGFEVGLSFGGIPERLVIPFAAVKGFFDPSVKFGLRFKKIGETSAKEQEGGAAGKDRAPAPSEAEHKEVAPAALAVPATANPDPGEQPAKPEGSAEVVRLARFRKK